MHKIFHFSKIRGHQTDTEKRHYSKTPNVLISLFLIAGTLSCDRYREADPVIKQYVQIQDSSRDTLVSIFNEKMSTKAMINFQETLTDTAVVRFSSDRSFLEGGGFLLPIENPPLMYVGGLVGDSLFIKYEPFKKSISGKLTIEVTFQ